ncbi:hypothetical protein HYH03_003827 [Edaphochlamys debaryana]|uniref:Uncharacterized protein n=1 Tax=Edaphochlamys debaryana TaxID=47281 RepID=A0A835YAT5_9CHLO|nr:hypothetical protein HYH03_003827 [Edaphochlamys debaryana]|eukprot:KAG2498067.1 hypothetical protein HYH03_003827 [Edaphochlamys debaryana]
MEVFARPPARAPVQSTSHKSSSRVVARATFGEFFGGFFDGSWAPKSTRAWRLNQAPREMDGRGEEPSTSAPGDAPGPERAIEDLQDRLSRLPASARRDLAGEGTSAADGSGFDGSSPMTKSFSDVDDASLSAALNARIGAIASSTASYDSTVTEEEMRQPLTADELRRLIFEKYNKTYDVSIVRRDLPGRSFVSMNIMWTHLEQRSFKMTEAQYMDKLDSVAFLVGALGQADKVRAFLKERAKSHNGLPPRPVMGSAITIRFDLEQSVIEEWFGAGYQ